MKFHTQTDQPITLSDELGQGGEARVHNVVEQPDVVAKLYHQPTANHAAKLRAMVSQPPTQPDSHTAIAWPSELLLDEHEKVVGFLMPKVAQAVSIFNLYNPIMRATLPYDCTWQMLHRIAYNLVTAVGYVHERGCVIGDINESNILVNPHALVTLIDSDSFQLMDTNGTVYRCPVGKPEYTPPELQGIALKEVTQTVEHDRFRVAVLLFQLLMNGFHPFTGIIPTTHSVGRVDLYAIRQGIFPFVRPGDALPPPHAPPFSMLHPELQAAFRCCFVVGHGQPEARPTIAKWQAVLQTAEQALQTCSVNPQHLYSNHQEQCSWCEFEQRRVTPSSQALPQEAGLQRLYAEALEAYHRTDAETVMAKLNQLIEAGSASADVYAYRGWGAYQQKAYQAAVADSYRALSQEPENVTAHYVMGLTRAAQADYEAAVSSFSRAVSTGQVSQQPRVLYERALAYKAMERHPLALRDLERYQLLETDRQWLAKGKSEKQLIETALAALKGVSKSSKKSISWIWQNYFGGLLGVLASGFTYWCIGTFSENVSEFWKTIIMAWVFGMTWGFCQEAALKDKLPQLQSTNLWPLVTAASVAIGVLMFRFVLWADFTDDDFGWTDFELRLVSFGMIGLIVGISQAAVLNKSYECVWIWVVATFFGVTFIASLSLLGWGGACGLFLVLGVSVYILPTGLALEILRRKPKP